MTMRLLSKKEVQAATKQEERLAKIQIREASAVLKEELAKLEKVRKEFQLEIKRQEKNLSEEILVLLDQKKQLQEETFLLQRTRDRLLASPAAKELKEREQNLLEAECRLAEREAVHRDQAYALSLAEVEAKTSREKLEQEQKDLAFRQAQIEKGEISLSDRLSDLQSSENAWRKTIEDFKSWMVQEEIRLKQGQAKIFMEDKAVYESRLVLDKERQEIKRERRKLQDGYATLERSKERLKK